MSIKYTDLMTTTTNDGYPDAVQAQFLRTWRDAGKPFDSQLVHLILGLCGETGELSDLLKKHLFKPGVTIAGTAVMDELSDVFFYVALMAYLWGFTIDDMVKHLGEKLADGHGWVGGEE